MTKSRFPERGLLYFWFLNDECREEHIDWQIAEFAKAGVAAVVLHPRAGLLFPYGGDDWFAFIRRTARQCAAAGVSVWLYDEDPYPSGNAGGWITVEHPELRARTIDRFVAESALKPGELFCFPTGILLWAGLVPDDPAGSPAALTAQVGIVRREWRELLGWDSRWYYPGTPLYKCDRADTYTPEFALRAPPVPPGHKLVAFVARETGADAVWGALHDSLNPRTAELFIERTHERYRQELGDLFGREITAIFTDEPKYFGGRPWTAELLADFARAYGYDLREHLNDLFTDSMEPRAILTRLHYREWCGRRFAQVWLRPVSRWCRRHGLKLVGHISPEDDPVEQANTISNLFPLIKHFDLAGLDLIIPAVGDRRHPLINIGPTTAASVAQQTRKPGVMSETLGCSGLDLTAAAALRILRWQMVMGVTTPVVHGAFASVAGKRLIDAPPDFGPHSSRWAEMNAARAEFAAVQDLVIGATQVAPVAILWPIRSFQASAQSWQGEPGGRRGELADLLLACLERQVGTHLLDEDDLLRAVWRRERLCLGRAAYSHLLVPSCLVLHQQTLTRLHELQEAGLSVCFTGELPTWALTGSELEPAGITWVRVTTAASVVLQLPRLAEVQAARPEDLRLSVWRRGRRTVSLLMNLGETDQRVGLNGEEVTAPAGQLVVVRG